MHYTNGSEALAHLLEGNRRFAAGEGEHVRQDPQRRAELTRGQRPFAVVVGCSDSRVPPEVVFDQGLGDLFVIRTAGHVIDDVTVGSVDYAVSHLGAPLVLVLGHTFCGAVHAAVAGREVSGTLRPIVRGIKPAMKRAKGSIRDPEPLVVRAHVELSVEKLWSALQPDRKRTASSHPLMAGGVYDLDTGLVEIITTEHDD